MAARRRPPIEEPSYSWSLPPHVLSTWDSFQTIHNVRMNDILEAKRVSQRMARIEGMTLTQRDNYLEFIIALAPPPEPLPPPFTPRTKAEMEGP